MSTSRATLRAQVAALRDQNDRLTQELEQALRERLPTNGGPTAAGASGGDPMLLSHEESVTILEAQRQTTEDLQAELVEAQERYQELDHVCSGLHDQIQRLREEAKLERLRAVETERCKWEAREERLVEQLRNLQSQLAANTEVTPSSGQGSPTASPQSDKSGDKPDQRMATSSTTNSNKGMSDNSRLNSSTTNSGESLSAALLAQQLPPLTKFSGEDLENETFQDCVTQFGMVADLYHWSPAAKLIHLTTRLRGQAFAFYKSCAPEQKSDYDRLESELTKRFTPVRIQAVQTSCFHERKQQQGEAVNSFAQELRKLFQKAYPTSARSSKEMEEMGQSVLSSQFVAGLVPELKTKVAGIEGNLEKLLTKARFEEAKRRDLFEVSKQQSSTPKPNTAPPPTQSDRSRPPRLGPCHHCGAIRHVALNVESAVEPPRGNLLRHSVPSKCECLSHRKDCNRNVQA